MRIIKTILPKDSILNTSHEKPDYTDSFQGALSDPYNRINTCDIGKAFFSSGPKWVGKLFNVRNKIVSVFGLKTPDNRAQQLRHFKCEPGEQMGLFKIFDKTDNEIIMGEDDKHLNFRVSLFLQPHENNPTHKKLIVSTTVAFNNWFGRLYFLAVRPFHKIIVPVMLNGIRKQLEAQHL